MAGSDENEVPSERRDKQRKATRIRGWADPGGVAAPSDCLILDLSPTGARLIPVDERRLPDQFTLLSDAHSPLGEARVVWRGDKMVGVTFEQQDPTRGDVDNVRRELGLGPVWPTRLRRRKRAQEG